MRDTCRRVRSIPFVKFVLLALPAAWIIYAIPFFQNKVNGLAEKDLVNQVSLSQSSNGSTMKVMKLPLFLSGAVLIDIVWVPMEKRLVMFGLKPHPRLFLNGRLKSEQFNVSTLRHLRAILPALTIQVLSHSKGIVTINASALQWVEKLFKTGDFHFDHVMTRLEVRCDDLFWPFDSKKDWMRLVIGSHDKLYSELSLSTRQLSAWLPSLKRTDNIVRFVPSQKINPTAYGHAIQTSMWNRFLPYIHEIVSYYKTQGFSHVYLNIDLIDEEYSKLIVSLTEFIEQGFVSIIHPGDNSGLFKSELTLRLFFIKQSIHFYSKSFDKLITMIELDDIPVALGTTLPLMQGSPGLDTFTTRIEKKLKLHQNACGFQLEAHVVSCLTNDEWNIATEKNYLHEKFPRRCHHSNGDGFNQTKATVVTAKSDSVAAHTPGNCKNTLDGDERPCTAGTCVWMTDEVATIHVYNLWTQRYDKQRGTCAKETRCNMSFLNEFSANGRYYKVPDHMKQIGKKSFEMW